MPDQPTIANSRLPPTDNPIFNFLSYGSSPNQSLGVMIANILHLETSNIDLAGEWSTRPSVPLLYRRLHHLLDRYLQVEILNDRLADLPKQFQHPQPRPWQGIEWHRISAEQIIGVEPLVFLSILVGSIDTETPIRGYTQTSRQYLESLYPEMAEFVGGEVDAQGVLTEPGLWEKEERRHAPALQRIYTELTGLKLRPVTHTPRTYQPTGNPAADLYHHGLHRVATEYGATCLYLWLMAHSTGHLQIALSELLIDEINHMTKFWGFGCWAYPDASMGKALHTIFATSIQNRRQKQGYSSLLHTLKRMAQVLHWEAWSGLNRLTLLWTFAIVLHRLCHWSDRLTPEALQQLFNPNSP